MQRHNLTFPKESFLGRIDQESWTQLNSLWSVSTYPSGHFLISADDDGRDVFFVLDGAVKATIYTDNGREVAFLRLANGDCIGEFSAIDNAPRSSDVIAEKDSIVARLSAEQFRRLLQTHPNLSYTLLTLLVGHLRQLSKRVVDFNSKSADERLRGRMLELAEASARGDEAIIERPPTQTEFAAYVFSSRESVAREMGRMRHAGVLGRKKRALHFPSIIAFRDYINSL